MKKGFLVLNKSTRMSRGAPLMNDGKPIMLETGGERNE